jgi:hypothetical protein
MKKLILSLTVILSVSVNQVSAQIKPEETTAILETLYGRLMTIYTDDDRVRINDSIKTIIDSYVTSDSVFNHRFRTLRYLGQITSPDSVLKIVTWNLVLGSGNSRYYCYFIRKQERGKPNLIWRLTSPYRETSVKTDTIYTESDWYGALYYDLRPFNVKGMQHYVLLGIDYGNPYVSRKLVDVISFTKGNSIIFGKRWFSNGITRKYRDVQEYASNGMMSMRFTSDTSIVFDHLVPFMPSQKDDRQYYGPDYSYDAWYFDKDKWYLVINVDARNKE